MGYWMGLNMTKKKWYRPYLFAGLVWVSLLVVLNAALTAWEESIQPSYEEEFQLAPKDNIKYVCPGQPPILEIFFRPSEQHPCAFGEKVLAIGWVYAHFVYAVLWILITVPYMIFSIGLRTRDLTDVSFWVMVLLCPWFFIPLVGYGISRFDRWKEVRKLSEPPLAPPL